MSEDLANRRCKPCEGGIPALSAGQAAELLAALHEDWSLIENGRTLSRTFKFPAYSRSLGFANAVAWIAIVEGHHPDMTVRYGSCTVNYTTHAIDGLSDNDFICAAKIDQLAEASG
jgi:4a-hydroxytetrahydrobiopterin dehydratase